MTGGQCPACGAALRLLWVHGHGQCTVCGVNVAPCCSGAGDEVDALEAPDTQAVLHTLLAMLSEAGSLLERDLLNAFAAHTGCSIDLARSMLGEALTGGQIRRSDAGVLSLADRSSDA